VQQQQLLLVLVLVLVQNAVVGPQLLLTQKQQLLQYQLPMVLQQLLHSQLPPMAWQSLLQCQLPPMVWQQLMRHQLLLVCHWRFGPKALCTWCSCALLLPGPAHLPEQAAPA
jgi:hypothetical protein